MSVNAPCMKHFESQPIQCACNYATRAALKHCTPGAGEAPSCDVAVAQATTKDSWQRNSWPLKKRYCNAAPSYATQKAPFYQARLLK